MPVSNATVDQTNESRVSERHGDAMNVKKGDHK